MECPVEKELGEGRGRELNTEEVSLRRRKRVEDGGRKKGPRSARRSNKEGADVEVSLVFSQSGSSDAIEAATLLALGSVR